MDQKKRQDQNERERQKDMFNKKQQRLEKNSLGISEKIKAQYDKSIKNKKEIGDRITSIPKSDKCIILIGNTGLGKSCLFEFLLGAQIQMVPGTKVSPTGIFKLESLGKEQNRQLIKHGRQTGTHIPNFGFFQDEDSHLIDLPGFYDQQGEEIWFEHSLIQLHTLSGYQKIKLLAVIDYDWLDANSRKNQGGGLMRFIELLKASILKNNPEYVKYVSFIVSKLPLGFASYSQQEIYTYVLEEWQQYKEKNEFHIVKTLLAQYKFYFLIPKNYEHPYQQERLSELKNIIIQQDYMKGFNQEDLLLQISELKSYILYMTKDLVQMLRKIQKNYLEVLKKRYDQFSKKLMNQENCVSSNHADRREALLFYQLNAHLDEIHSSCQRIHPQKILGLFRSFWTLYKDRDKTDEDTLLPDIENLYAIIMELCLTQFISDEKMGLEFTQDIFKKDFIKTELQLKQKKMPSDLQQMNKIDFQSLLDELKQNIQFNQETIKIIQEWIKILKFVLSEEIKVKLDTICERVIYQIEASGVFNYAELGEALKTIIFELLGKLEFIFERIVDNKCKFQKFKQLQQTAWKLLPEYELTNQLLNDDELKKSFDQIEFCLRQSVQPNEHLDQLHQLLDQVRSNYYPGIKDYLDEVRKFTIGFYQFFIKCANVGHFVKIYSKYLKNRSQLLGVMSQIEQLLQGLKSLNLDHEEQ